MKFGIAAALRAPLLFLLLGLAATSPALAARLGPTLVERLATAQPDERLEVIVSFHGRSAPTARQLELLRKVGVGGLYLRALPMAGVLATPRQIERLAALPEVRSLWLNDRLEYEMEQARTLTSVEALKANAFLRATGDLPYTGRGVSILVNDSGVDATHRDLPFGTKVIQNVAGHTGIAADIVGGDLRPLLPTENVPNTDGLGSHGTHVAGIAAGLGTMSDGRFAGAAIGANLIGYGSGAAISILNTAGGFDYALLNRHRYNIRVITNSFGGPSTIGQKFDHDDPINIASKLLADAGVITVFSAGNSGSGPDTITGPYKKAPWVVLAGNGEKDGSLAASSSRGPISGGVYVYEFPIDGEIFTIEDRPSVVAPGTAIVSTRALVTGDATGNLGFAEELEALGPELAPFYSIKTGTSMAAPHVAGLVAILLEANPLLGWRDVKRILQQSASNMSGYEPWEVGAGFANIEAAVALALQARRDIGRTNNLKRTAPFRANSTVVEGSTAAYTIDFMPAPAGMTGFQEFDVGPDVAVVTARWEQPLGSPCTCAVVLFDPDGKRFGSGIAQPVLGPIVSAAAPGKAGRWRVTMRGIGAVSGVDVDPVDATNGVAGPESVEVTVKTFVTEGFTGLDDIAAHPLRGIIEAAAANRLVDGLGGGVFAPDRRMTRIQLAQYLAMGFGLRQRLALDRSLVFGDLGAYADAFAQVATADGALLFDLDDAASPAMLADRDGGVFNPSGIVSREQLAYSLVQVLGLEDAATAAAGNATLTAPFDGKPAPVVDGAAVSPALRGHVQVALDLGVLVPAFFVDNADPENPVIKARLTPAAAVTRAQYAQSAFVASLWHLR